MLLAVIFDILKDPIINYQYIHTYICTKAISRNQACTGPWSEHAWFKKHTFSYAFLNRPFSKLVYILVLKPISFYL